MRILISKSRTSTEKWLSQKAHNQNYPKGGVKWLVRLHCSYIFTAKYVNSESTRESETDPKIQSRGATREEYYVRGLG